MTSNSSCRGQAAARPAYSHVQSLFNPVRKCDQESAPAREVRNGAHLHPHPSPLPHAERAGEGVFKDDALGASPR
jgi:hypothetical protein